MEEDSSKQKSPISAPSEPGIMIRTMESDVEAIEQGGGEIAALQRADNEESAIKEPGKWKFVGIIIWVLVIIVIFGLLGYFVVSSWFFPKEMPAVQ